MSNEWMDVEWMIVKWMNGCQMNGCWMKWLVNDYCTYKISRCQMNEWMADVEYSNDRMDVKWMNEWMDGCQSDEWILNE